MRWRSRLGIRACLDLGFVACLSHPVFSGRRLSTRPMIQRQHQWGRQTFHPLAGGAVDSGGDRLRSPGRLPGGTCFLDGLEVGAGQRGQRDTQRHDVFMMVSSGWLDSKVREGLIGSIQPPAERNAHRPSQPCVSSIEEPGWNRRRRRVREPGRRRLFSRFALAGEGMGNRSRCDDTSRAGLTIAGAAGQRARDRRRHHRAGMLNLRDGNGSMRHRAQQQ